MKRKEKQLDIDDVLVRDDEVMDVDTGEISRIAKEVLNVCIWKESRREDGSLRIQQDFSNCPTLAEQHTAHLTDLNYLIERFKPDELASYIAARNSHKREIVGHDFSKEPSLVEAKNVVYRSQKEFEKLPDDIRKNFKNHVEFLKFIDNPANAEKMIQLGLLKKKQVENLQSLERVEDSGKPADVDSKKVTKEKEEGRP